MKPVVTIYSDGGLDENAKSMRSSWLAAVSACFLWLPIQIKESATSLQLSNLEQHNGKTFSEFKSAQYLQINSSLDWNKLSYDLDCPIVKSNIETRTC